MKTGGGEISLRGGACPTRRVKGYHHLERMRQAFPYGRVEVEVVDGGMTVGSGTLLPDKGDKNDLIYVVNAAVWVGY